MRVRAEFSETVGHGTIATEKEFSLRVDPEEVQKARVRAGVYVCGCARGCGVRRAIQRVASELRLRKPLSRSLSLVSALPACCLAL